jgi:hypothetical protein
LTCRRNGINHSYKASTKNKFITKTTTAQILKTKAQTDKEENIISIKEYNSITKALGR